ncbi:hypothetical protein RISK_001677 [Rhodopirellula islandica]|uniref:Uncharacterized protein n=1 Tax=Rhodopirellula islandica TaxID=595434 RepID=A0A0J1BIU5_RHOIS|nr:hypothetical protein RISK_001677 [Rhodopirellula islandica]
MRMPEHGIASAISFGQSAEQANHGFDSHGCEAGTIFIGCCDSTVNHGFFDPSGSR